MLHVRMAAAEFERDLIHERSVLGEKRYRAQYEAGKVGKEVHRKSGENLPVGRQKRVLDRHRVLELRQLCYSYRRIARELAVRRVFPAHVSHGSE